MPPSGSIPTNPLTLWWYNYLYELMDLGPVVMTETCDEAGTIYPDQVIRKCEEMKISWQWLAGNDFGTHTGFDINDPMFAVHWPADPGCTGGTVMVGTPSFNPAPGTYTGSAVVSISCATSGAAIRYTTDGSTPTSGSTQYSGPITITSTTTIKAKAFKSGSDPSSVATATYTIAVDNTPPAIAAVTACGDPTRVQVVFSEALDQATAQSAGNFSVSNGVSVSTATLGTDKRSVTLKVSTLAEGTTYTLTVNNVKDLSGNPVAANSTKMFQYVTGWTDDFSDGNYTANQAWTPGEGSWTVTSGQVNNLTAEGRTSLIGGDPAWTDYTFSADVTPVGGANPCDVWLIFRAQDANNYYLFTLMSASVYKLVNGSYTLVRQGQGVTFTAGTTYNIQVEVSGSTITVYNNSTLVLTATDTQFAGGRVGFGSNSATGTFDNAVVTFSSTVTSFSRPGPAVFWHSPAWPNVMEYNAVFDVTGLQPAQNPMVLIYAQDGSWVKELTPGNPGDRLQWDGTDARGVPAKAGMYFYRVTAGQDQYIGRIVKIR